MSNNKYLSNNRTIFGLPIDNVNHSKQIVGFIIYFLLFILFIPLLLIKYNYFNILAAYFPNLDLIASVLGYHGGPMNTFIWKHLYNPVDTTLTGYISSNLINFFSLLGLTYTVAYYTYINKNINKGWSRAIIMLPMTYFLPGNIIILYINKFGNYLNNFILNGKLLHYLLVIILGFILTIMIILFEVQLIERLSPYIVYIIEKILNFF